MFEPVAENLGPTYRDLIREAFIDPIRTAVVVDDEYPTLDELLLEADALANESETDKERRIKKRQNWQQVREILQFCRDQQPKPWLVAVHDGRTPSFEGEQASVSHLDHSDLLILDYHLDSTQGSEKAIEILRRLAANGHFNLVVVYTKDRDETGAGIARTVNEIALSLASPVSAFELNSAKVNAWESKLETWEEIDSCSGIFTALLESIDEAAFLKVLEHDNPTWEALRSIAEFSNLAIYLDAIPPEVKLSADQILQLLMHKRQTHFRSKMFPSSSGKVTTGKKGNQVNWVRVDSLFVTVVSKEHAPSTIPDRLLNALEAWDPVPHRLIMSKMRSELGQQGVVAEAQVLMNRHLQAGWLEEILEADEAKRRTNVHQGVARHWESLGGKIEPRVLDFALRLATHLSSNADRLTLIERFDRYAASKQQAEVYLHLNCHACSKPVEGHHLSIGHVLHVGDQYWLCLTPACDLEPGQKEGRGWYRRLGSWLPFKAVRIYPANNEVALRESTRGYHLFLYLDASIKVFGFAEATNGMVSATPTLGWEQLFAGNDGIFEGHNKLTVASIGKNGKLDLETRSAIVVAQLRYEYALNLMHRLGSHLSRVGLDFISYTPTE